MVNFLINHQYLCEVPLIRTVTMFDDFPQLNCKAGTELTLHGQADHPKFALLREFLAREQFIEIQRMWLNVAGLDTR